MASLSSSPGDFMSFLYLEVSGWAWTVEMNQPNLQHAHPLKREQIRRLRLGPRVISQSYEKPWAPVFFVIYRHFYRDGGTHNIGLTAPPCDTLELVHFRHILYSPQKEPHVYHVHRRTALTALGLGTAALLAAFLEVLESSATTSASATRSSTERYRIRLSHCGGNHHR